MVTNHVIFFFHVSAVRGLLLLRLGGLLLLGLTPWATTAQGDVCGYSVMPDLFFFLCFNGVMPD